MNRKLLRMTVTVMVLIVLTVLLGGCWDSVEIEERGFVVGTAIDAAEDDQITITFQIVLPAQMKGGSGQKSEGGDPYTNISSTARTVFKAARNMSNEVSRSPYLAHNQLIIISDEIAKSDHIADVLDLFVRDPENRRASHILIAKGRASDILDIRTRVETLPVQYISSTQHNPDKSESITPPTNIGDLHNMLLSNTSYTLPAVERINERQISTIGAAVFNGQSHKFLGYLGYEETTGRNMVFGTVKTASLELELDESILVLEIREFHRSTKVSIDNRGMPVFDLIVAVNGSIGESELGDGRLIKDLNKEIRQKGEEKIEQLIRSVIEKSQKEYKTDFLGFGSLLYKEQYHLWKTYQSEWEAGEHLYSQCKVNIHINLNVETIGTITKSK